MAQLSPMERRKARVRRQVRAAANGRPRLSVFRSSKQIYAQIIDDAKGVTIVSASTVEKDLRGSLKTGADIEAAQEGRRHPGRVRPRLVSLPRPREGSGRGRP